MTVPAIHHLAAFPYPLILSLAKVASKLMGGHIGLLRSVGVREGPRQSVADSSVMDRRPQCTAILHDSRGRIVREEVGRSATITPLEWEDWEDCGGYWEDLLRVPLLLNTPFLAELLVSFISHPLSHTSPLTLIPFLYLFYPHFFSLSPPPTVSLLPTPSLLGPPLLCSSLHFPLTLLFFSFLSSFSLPFRPLQSPASQGPTVNT